MLFARTRTPLSDAGGPFAATRALRARRVVLVHGFTQTSASWNGVADALVSRGLQVTTVDAPGHGASTAVRADLWGGAAMLADAGGPATYVGYSMGARVCLHAALLGPESVKGLVLISGTAGIDDATERAERRAGDERLATDLERDGLAPFLERWLANPLFATLPRSAWGLEARHTNTVAGLASSLRLAGTGTQDPPLWNRLGELARIPVLVMAGALDPKFVLLAQRLAGGIGPTAALDIVENAGHSAHLEQPSRVIEAIYHFVMGNPSA